MPLLKDNPALQPITLLDVLADKAPHEFDQSTLRTLQRRVKRWRAEEGPDQEVIFRQRHMPGDMGISDYTWMNVSFRRPHLNFDFIPDVITPERTNRSLYEYKFAYPIAGTNH